MERLIERYKNYRNFKNIATVFEGGYAFVGVGSHSAQNLYPVIDYLHVPLSYICCRDACKIPFIEKKYRGVKGTTELDEVLADNSVRGVFVSVGPQAHFNIAKRVMSAGKSLFIEKPPCQSLSQLDELIKAEQALPGIVALVGLQKRYSPCVMALAKALKRDAPISYRLVYATGLYPEGDPVIELFIHPLDMVCFLFGRPQVKGFTRIVKSGGGVTVQMLLEHHGVSGVVELSTNYSWRHPVEQLSVNTSEGVYKMDGLDSLSFSRHGGAFMNMPLEKVFGGAVVEKYLYLRDRFNPVLSSNQVYSNGFYDEIKTFVTLVEKHKGKNLSPFSSLRDTYRLLENVRRG